MPDPNEHKLIDAMIQAAENIGMPPGSLDWMRDPANRSCPDCDWLGLNGRPEPKDCGTCEGRGWVRDD